VGFLNSRCGNALGDGTTDWRSSVDPAGPQNPAQTLSSAQDPGGLLGLMQEYLRNNPEN
jgi:hypothetical protein